MVAHRADRRAQALGSRFAIVSLMPGSTGPATKHPTHPVVLRIVASCGLAFGSHACGDDARPATPVAAAAPPTASVTVHQAQGDPHHIRVHHAAALVGMELSQTTDLDLALSESDRVGQLADADAATVCDGLDLLAVAQRAPKLRRVRISGCPAAVRAGLGAFGTQLHRLELADLTLDGVTVGALGQLTSLQSLTLVRVALGTDVFGPLKNLPLREVVLRDLEKNSEIARALDLWPRSLTRVVLDGDWAGHDAMLTLAKAEALEELELVGTRIGNFSLNQIKSLDKLRRVVFDGSTFNDNSPLYFRELPQMTEFVCNCKRFGDGGLRSLRHSPGLRRLELRESDITGIGLEALAKLDDLHTLIVLDRDLGAEGFAALTHNPSLRRLELSGPLASPKLTGLSALSGLQHLALGCPRVDDRSTDELGELTQLRSLDLSGTQISDKGLENLGKLTELRELRLGRTQITKAGLTHLAELSKLETLHLDHTDLVDEGVAALAGLGALQELRLDHTLITDGAIDTLLTMKSLARLSLADTVVTEAGVARLEALPKLDAIDIEHIRG